MTGSIFRRILPGFSQFRRPARAISSGSQLTGGLPSGLVLEDTNGNSWYFYIDTNGVTRIVPAGTIEPVPQTNPITYDFATAAGAFSATPFQKTIGSMSDATFTDTVSFSVPNVGISASFLFLVTGALGAGGAIGAGEAVASQILTISVARVAGVNAVANQASVAVTSNGAVAGATTIALANQLSSISGAVGAVNTFTLQTRITKGGGASSNHTASVVGWMMNPTATGVSLS